MPSVLVITPDKVMGRRVFLRAPAFLMDISVRDKVITFSITMRGTGTVAKGGFLVGQVKFDPIGVFGEV